KVGRRHINRHSTRKRQSIFELALKQAGQQNSEQSCATKRRRRLNRFPLPLAASKKNGSDRKSFRQFVQKHRDKNYRSEPGRNQKSRSDGHPVKKSVNRQPKHHAALRAMMRHLFRVRLFAKMKMRRKRVLKKMYEKKSGKNIKQRAFSRERDGLR